MVYRIAVRQIYGRAICGVEVKGVEVVRRKNGKVIAESLSKNDLRKKGRTRFHVDGPDANVIGKAPNDGIEQGRSFSSAEQAD